MSGRSSVTVIEQNTLPCLYALCSQDHTFSGSSRNSEGRGRKTDAAVLGSPPELMNTGICGDSCQ